MCTVRHCPIHVVQGTAIRLQYINPTPLSVRSGRIRAGGFIRWRLHQRAAAVSAQGGTMHIFGAES
jgi:hypothetical protein